MNRTRSAGAWTLTLLLALAPVPAAWSQPQEQEPIRLPSLGEPDVGEFTETGERRIGELVMRQVRRDPSYLDDPQLLAHVQSLWEPLLHAARKRGEIGAETDAIFAWETFLIRDRSINAFALPGGYIGVHLGLIAQSVAQDELAAVLAHELSHVTQRHIARSQSSARKQSMLGIAGLLLSILAAARSGNTDVAQAGVMGSQAAMAQAQLNFSRDMEREADRIGLTLMTEAGYEPSGVAAMFERLEKANRLNDNGSFPYLRSHPLTIERIGEARDRAQALEASRAGLRLKIDQSIVITGQADGSRPPPPAQHQLMRARARVLMDTSVPALRYWQRLASEPASPEDRAVTLYAATLSSVLLGESESAQQHLQALRKVAESPVTRLWLELLNVEVWMSAQQPARALQLLESMDASVRAVRLARVEAALRWWQRAANSSERAAAQQALNRHTDSLSAWVLDHRLDALAWSQLASAQQALGQQLRAVRAEAESRWALGDLNGALDRFKSGQRLVRSSPRPDHIEASVIDARVRELERARRRAFAEMRGVREEDLPPVLPPNVPM